MPKTRGRARERILEAAERLFTEDGYSATTMDRIAGEASVAVQTVYFTFHNKRSVLKDVIDTRVAGDTAPVATLDRAWVARVLEAPGPERHVTLQVRGAGAIHRRVAPLLEVLHQAALQDAAVADLWEANKRQRREVHEHLLRSLRRKRSFRKGMTLARATDVCWAMLGPELYLLMTREQGWTPSAWEKWTARTLYASLFGAGPD